MSKIFKKRSAVLTKPESKRRSRALSDSLPKEPISPPAFFKATIPVTKADLLAVLGLIPSDVVVIELMHGTVEDVPDVTMLCLSDLLNTTKRVFTTKNIVEHYRKVEHVV